MKDLFNNLGIRIKLLIGFLFVLIILISIGIVNYNTLKKLDEQKRLILIGISTADAIKQIKYLFSADVIVVNKIEYASTEKEIKKLYQKHIDNEENLYRQLNSIKDRFNFDTKNKFLTNYKIQIKDTLYVLQNLYENKLKITYNEIAEIRKLLVNQGLLEEKLKLSIKKVDSINKQHIRVDSLLPDIVATTKEGLVEIYENQLHERYLFIDRNLQTVLNRLNAIEKITDTLVNQSSSEGDRLSRVSLTQSGVIIILALIASIFIAILISNLIVYPLNRLKHLTYKLAKGELPDYTPEKTLDEIGEMSTAIASLIDGLKKTSDFAFEIGKGNFSSDFQPLSEKDVLGNSLLNMRKSLQIAKVEEEKRKIEDIHRNWATEGLAKFAEILRHHTENITELANDIIQNLVNYLKANQGGLFIYNDSDINDIYLELLAAYAYNRKKFVQKRIKLGEGLIGAVALEKYTIYMTDVPNEYIEIESGIGSANPKSILIVPLKIENDILGIIELASFNELQKHEIELVEKIAESIASTLSTARINTRTAELLEQSKQQALEMRDQEEEMKQTIEELQTTQEETIKREEQLKQALAELEAVHRTLEEKDRIQQDEISLLKSENEKKILALQTSEQQSKKILAGSIDGVLVFNSNGIIDFFNKAAQIILGYKEVEIIGRNIKALFPFIEKSQIKNFVDNIDSLLLETIGDGQELVIKQKNGIETSIYANYISTTVSGEKKYTIFIKDLTELKKHEAERNKLMENLMAKEFEYSIKIDMMEDMLRKNSLQIPSIEDITELIRWEDGYSIELNIIDMQHKRWIELINKFYRAFKEGQAAKALSGMFSELIDYTEYHFGFEEKYLNDFKVTGYIDHKQEHDKFNQQLSNLYDEFRSGKIDVAYNLMIFLKTWVRNHIQNQDRMYVESFRKNGLS